MCTREDLDHYRTLWEVKDPKRLTVINEDSDQSVRMQSCRKCCAPAQCYNSYINLEGNGRASKLHNSGIHLFCMTCDPSTQSGKNLVSP